MRTFAVLRILLLLVAAGLSGCHDPDGASGPPLHLRSFSHDGRTDVPPNWPLWFRFTAPIDASTLNPATLRIQHRNGAGDWVDAAGALILDRSRVFFDPTRSQESYERDGLTFPSDNPRGFPELTEFRVVIPSARTSRRCLRSRGGMLLEEEFRSTFATAALEEDYGPPFEVVSTSPPDGATCVPAASSIAVRLSHPLIPGGLAGDADLRVFDYFTGEVIPGALEFGGGLDEIVFRPTAGYGDEERTVGVLVGTGIRNARGSPLAREHRFEFGTAAPGGDCARGCIVEDFRTDRFEDEAGTGGFVRATWWRDERDPYGWTGGLRGRTFHHEVRHLAGGPAPSRSRIPWAPGKPVRWQVLIPLEALGPGSEILGASFGLHSASRRRIPDVRVRLGLTDLAALGPDLDANFSGPPVPIADLDVEVRPGYGFESYGWWYGSFPLNDRDNLVLEIEHGGARGEGGGPRWLGGETGDPGRSAYTVGGGETRLSSWAPDLSFDIWTDRSAALSLFYDTGIPSPRFLPPTVRTDPETLPAGQAIEVSWQGADDPAAPATDWLHDVAGLAGHRYVRFKVEFTGSPAVEEILLPWVRDE